MEKVLDFIWRQRHVREFTGATVTEEQIQSLLEAAMGSVRLLQGPVGIYRPAGKRDAESRFGMPAERSFYQRALLGIIVCGDIRQAHSGSLSYLLQDCAAATNCSSCGIRPRTRRLLAGIHPREERITALRKLFHTPESLVPFGGIAVGVPAAEVMPRTRFNPAKVHNAAEWKKQE